MTDSIERLFEAIQAARDFDPARSRTARLFAGGDAKIAKKLTEEAIEVSIDVVRKDAAAVTRESADLLYNLVVSWVATGVRPQDVWDEMMRREQLLGLAEKLPKNPSKAMRKNLAEMGRAAIIPLEPLRPRKRG